MAGVVPRLVQEGRGEVGVGELVQVEVALREGPDGLFLIKNSTEFPGDLTLCLYKVGGGTAVEFRIISAPVHKGAPVQLIHPIYFMSGELVGPSFTEL